jgi:hypothetical protein
VDTPPSSVIDDRFGGDEAPGVYWQTEEDTLEQCDPMSLEIVGTVTNAGLRKVAALFQKVDRFSKAPVPAPEEVAEPAEPTEPAEPEATPEPTGTPEEAALPSP